MAARHAAVPGVERGRGEEKIVARQSVSRPVVQPIQERFLAELIGTFLLTFVVGGAISASSMILHNTGQLSRPSDILVFAMANGLALFVAVAAFGRISGAHVNPAVTIGLAGIRRFPWEDVFPYLLAQFIGATLAGLTIVGVYGTLPVKAAAGHLGAPALGTNIGLWQGLLAEALGAFFIVFTVLATAIDERAAPGWGPLAIGMSLAAGVLVLGFATGAAFNPARAFGPDLVAVFFGAPVDWLAYLVCYLIGPIIGGLVAAFAYRFVARLPRAR